MRKMFVAACLTLGLIGAASLQGAARADEPGWTYAYAGGIATATQRDDRGRVTATLTCRPPTGDLIITDYTLVRDRRANRAAVGIGNLTINVPPSVDRAEGGRALIVRLPQRPPILAGVQPSDRLTVAVGGRTHTYLAGSATRMSEVAYACWQGGS